MKVEQPSYVWVKGQQDLKPPPKPDPAKEVRLQWKDWDYGEIGQTQDPMLDQIQEQAHKHRPQKILEILMSHLTLVTCPLLQLKVKNSIKLKQEIVRGHVIEEKMQESKVKKRTFNNLITKIVNLSVAHTTPIG